MQAQVSIYIYMKHSSKVYANTLQEYIYIDTVYIYTSGAYGSHFHLLPISWQWKDKADVAQALQHVDTWIAKFGGAWIRIVDDCR